MAGNFIPTNEMEIKLKQLYKRKIELEDLIIKYTDALFELKTDIEMLEMMYMYQFNKLNKL